MIRFAQPLDAGRVGAILTEFTTETPWMPRLHTAAEDIRHAEQMIDQGLVTVFDDGALRGFLARRKDDVLSLYVRATDRRRGIGCALLDAAKAQSAVLTLWTFRANHPARSFYRREGFSEIGRTDGENEEGLPDVHLAWRRKGKDG
ncbi:MAG: GNAT family N-acetyltransferase [Pseudomonadota bacterium]